MASIFDANTAILRIAELSGQTYETAKRLFEEGQVKFSVPVTDENLQVDVDVAGLPRESDSEDLVFAHHVQAVGGVPETIRTVPAGKVFRLMGFQASTNNTATQEVILFDGSGVVDPDDVVFFGRVQTDENFIISSATPILKYAAGVEIKVDIQTTGGKTTIWGYDKDV